MIYQNKFNKISIKVTRVLFRRVCWTSEHVLLLILLIYPQLHCQTFYLEVIKWILYVTEAIKIVIWRSQMVQNLARKLASSQKHFQHEDRFRNEYRSDKKIIESEVVNRGEDYC